MSRDFHIRCKTCCVDHGFSEANHQDDFMRALVKHRDAIAALVPLFDDVGGNIALHAWFGSTDPYWFARHAGHELAVYDEYGAEDGKCGERYICESCATSHTCNLDKGHEGKHRKFS